MTDEQKADLARLPGWILEFRHLGFDKDAEALQRIHDVLSARLADAVQPAAGEGGLHEDDYGTPEELWDILINKDDRNSPEEYPEMALITFEEFADFCARARPAPSAQEPTR